MAPIRTQKPHDVHVDWRADQSLLTVVYTHPNGVRVEVDQGGAVYVLGPDFRSPPILGPRHDVVVMGGDGIMMHVNLSRGGHIRISREDGRNKEWNHDRLAYGAMFGGPGRNGGTRGCVRNWGKINQEEEEEAEAAEKAKIKREEEEAKKKIKKEEEEDVKIKKEEEEDVKIKKEEMDDGYGYGRASYGASYGAGYGGTGYGGTGYGAGYGAGHRGSGSPSIKKEPKIKEERDSD